MAKYKSAYLEKERQEEAMPSTRDVVIKRPTFRHGIWRIAGDGAPLVIRRFSTKGKEGLLATMMAGTQSKSKVKREKFDPQQTFEDARYRFKDGGDGFNASALRKALIEACRLVGFKMTLAKLSIFIEADGWDVKEPQIPLVRIHGAPVMQQDVARVDNGNPYITVRPAYHDWHADVKIRWDEDQFSAQDISNLLERVGQQVGLCEGRPNSKNGCGMGWGTFHVQGEGGKKKSMEASA